MLGVGVLGHWLRGPGAGAAGSHTEVGTEGAWSWNKGWGFGYRIEDDIQTGR